jgi:hypothetical protein
MVRENVCNLEGEEDDLYGLGPVEFADDFAADFGLKNSGLQCGQNSVNSLGGEEATVVGGV